MQPPGVGDRGAVLLLRALLGLEPVQGRMLVDPALPMRLGWLQILDIRGAWGTADAFGRARAQD
jgi:hypothetical protein